MGMMMSAIAITVAIVFAACIGASGTAAAMGAAYGGGAVRSLRAAAWLAAIFAALGAVTSGSHVAITISHGIIPNPLMTIEVSILLLIAACLTLYYANRIGIPLSTSEVTVGSLVGAGLAFSQVYWSTLALIVFAWLLTPILAFIISYMLNRWLAPLDKRLATKQGMWKQVLVLILIICGCYESFSAGMNNVANAVGPLIGAGIVPMSLGLVIGALAMACGAVTLGLRVLETNGKEITELSLLQGSVVSFTGGSLIMSASLIGLPVPLTQATTMAIIAAGGEKIGLAIFRKPVVKRIMFIWIISPVSSMIVAYLLMKIVVFASPLYLSLAFTSLLIVLVVWHMRNRIDRSPVLSDHHDRIRQFHHH